MKNKFLTVAMSFCLSAAIVASFCSCEAVKKKFAGGITDRGINVDSVSPGKVYTPLGEAPETVSVSYDTVYENCLFVGNSVMCDFFEAVTEWRKTDNTLFSKSYFFCNQNFGVYENNYTTVSAMSTHPKLIMGDEEIKCTIDEAVEKTGAKVVIFCLAGINDLPIYGDEENCHVKTASDMGKIISDLKSKYFDISIGVISTPYLSSSSTSMKSVNNEKIRALNEALSNVCTTSGADFIDISSLIANPNGDLKGEYSKDGYCRINESGSKVILSALRYYAKEKKGEI